MTDPSAGPLVLVLQALFELLVPHSLGLAAREIIVALLLAGVLWLCNNLVDRHGRESVRSVGRKRSWPRGLFRATA